MARDFYGFDFDPNDPGEAPYLSPEPDIDLSQYIPEQPASFGFNGSPITEQNQGTGRFDDYIRMQAYPNFSPESAGKQGIELSDKGIVPTFTNMPIQNENVDYADSGQIGVDMRPPTSYEPDEKAIQRTRKILGFVDSAKQYLDSKYPANYSTPQIETEKQSYLKFMMEQYSKDLDKEEKQQQKEELKQIDFENKRLIAEQKSQDALDREKFKTDVKRQNMFNLERKAHQYNVSKLQDISDAAKELLKTPGLSKIAGLSGYAPNFLITDEGRDADAKLKTLQAKISFDTLRDMRDNSKTGGALGQVSDVEIQLLMNSLVPLMRTQSETQFKQSLEKIIKVTDKAQKKLDGAYQELYGDLIENKSSGNQQSTEKPSLESFFRK